MFKVLFKAVAHNGRFRFYVQESNGQKWLIDQDGLVIEPQYQSEENQRELFAHLCWAVHTVPDRRPS